MQVYAIPHVDLLGQRRAQVPPRLYVTEYATPGTWPDHRLLTGSAGGNAHEERQVVTTLKLGGKSKERNPELAGLSSARNFPGASSRVIIKQAALVVRSRPYRNSGLDWTYRHDKTPAPVRGAGVLCYCQLTVGTCPGVFLRRYRGGCQIAHLRDNLRQVAIRPL